MVLVLLAEGADLNARDRDDNTPLHKVSADDRKGEVVEPHHVRLLQVEAKVKVRYMIQHPELFRRIIDALEKGIDNTRL